MENRYKSGSKYYVLAPGVQATFENFLDAFEEFMDKLPDDSVEDIKKSNITGGILKAVLSLPFATINFVTRNMHIVTAAMITPEGVRESEKNIAEIRADIRDKMAITTVSQVWADFFSQSDMYFVWLIVQKAFPVAKKARQILLETLKDLTEKQ